MNETVLFKRDGESSYDILEKKKISQQLASLRLMNFHTFSGFDSGKDGEGKKEGKIIISL